MIRPAGPTPPLSILALLVAFGTVPAPPAQGQETVSASTAQPAVSVPESIRVRNIPPLPASLAEKLRPYSQIRGAGF